MITVTIFIQFLGNIYSYNIIKFYFLRFNEKNVAGIPNNSQLIPNIKNNDSPATGPTYGIKDGLLHIIRNKNPVKINNTPNANNGFFILMRFIINSLILN